MKILKSKVRLQVKGRRRFGDSQVEFLENDDVFENYDNDYEDIDQSAIA